MKALLMHPDRDFDVAAAPPANAADLRQDLELDTLAGTMCGGDRFLFDVATVALLAPLPDPAAIRFRQAVLTDCLEQPAVVRELYELAIAAIQEQRRHWGFWSESPESILSGSLAALESFVGKLRELRAMADMHKPEFASEGFNRFFTMLQDELSDDYFELVEGQLETLRFKGGTLISARLGAGNKGIDYVLRLTPELSWRDRLAQLRRPALSFTIAERDQASLNALSKLNGRSLNHAANALAQSADHIKSFFTMLATELAFYIGCLNLHEHLAKLGEPTCLPDPAGPGAPRLSARGLYDVTLALRLDAAVVGNDADGDGKALVIVTGANQGGKSTFLRSLGLAQLMMQSGMFVPAESFSADVRDRVFTHYKREEDASMESGKLDEELARMSEIADGLTANSMLLCNESFSATNEREGSEIARQVSFALTEAGVKVVFVTHLYDFADRVHSEARADVLFLRAPRGDDGQRTFKLLEEAPLPTSYGADTYKQIFQTR